MSPDPSSATISAPEAFALLDVNRDAGYRAIRQNRFPVPVVHVGRSIRVPIAPLERLLNGDRGTALPAAELSESVLDRVAALVVAEIARRAEA